MIVYITLEHYDHEGDVVKGVRFNKEAAIAMARELITPNSPSFYSLRIEEWDESGRVSSLLIEDIEP